jgi:hypothetical protein
LFVVFSSLDFIFVNNLELRIFKALYHISHNTYYMIFPTLTNRFTIDHSKYFVNTEVSETEDLDSSTLRGSSEVSSASA